jgi:Ca2+/Na+ antiporter
MDDSDLDDRLNRIERRQKLVLALLVIPYLVVIADGIGVYVAAVLYLLLALVVFTVVGINRRNRRTTTGEESEIGP